MAIEATAIITAEIDSTQFNREYANIAKKVKDFPKKIESLFSIRDINKKFEIPKKIDVPKMELKPINKNVSESIVNIGKVIEAVSSKTKKESLLIQESISSLSKLPEKLNSFQMTKGIFGRKFQQFEGARFTSAFQNLMGSANSGEIKKGVANNLKNLSNAIGRLFSQINPGKTQELSNLLHAIENIKIGTKARDISSVANSLKEISNITIGREPLDSKDIRSVGLKVLSSMNKGIKQGGEEGRKQVQSVVNNLLNIISNFVPENIEDSGKKIPEQLAQGMESNIKKASDASNKVAKGIMDYNPQSPAKKGPLREIQKSGSKIVELLARGMYSAIPVISKASNSTAEALTDRLFGGVLNSLSSSGDYLKRETDKIYKDVTKYINRKNISSLYKSIKSQQDNFTKGVSISQLDVIADKGGRRKAIKAEAEAAFSKETLFRNLSSSLFNFASKPARAGFVVGGILEQVQYIFRLTLGKSQKIAEITATTISNSFFSAFRQKGTKKQKAAEAFIRGSIQNIFFAASLAAKSSSLLINRYTLSVFAALTYSIPKIVGVYSLKLFGALKSAVSGVFSKISSFSQSFSQSETGNVASEGIGIGRLISISSIVHSTALAANLQTELARIATITEQSGKSLKTTGREIIETSNLLGSSAIEAAKSLFDISSAGFRGNEGLLILKQSLIGAKAGFTDVSSISSTLVRTLRAFKIDASESGKVLDIIFNISKRGIIPFQELASLMPRVISISSSLGVGFDEVGAVIANLTRNGQTSEQAITGLSGIFRAIIRQTPQGTKQLKDLGVVLDQDAIKTDGLVETLKKISPIIQKNKGAFAKFLGDSSAINSILALSKDIVKDQGKSITSLEEDLEGVRSRGSAIEASSRIAETLIEKLKRAFVLFSNIFRNIGSGRLPIFGFLADRINETLEALAKLSNLDFSAFVGKSASAIKNIFSAASSSADELFSALKERAIFIGKIIYSGAKAGIKIFALGISEIITEAISSILQATKKIGIIGDYFGGSIDSASNSISNLIEFDFGKIISSSFEDVDFSKPFETSLESGLKKTLSAISEVSSKEFDGISKAPEEALARQRQEIQYTIFKLSEKMDEAAQKQNKERIEIISDLIRKEKDKIAQIDSQLDKSPLQTLFDDQLRLQKNLVRAQNSGSVEDQILLQEKLIDIIEKIKKEEELASKAQNKAKSALENQSEEQEKLINQAKMFGESVRRGTEKVRDFADEIDRIFGRNIQNLAERFGVGRKEAQAKDILTNVLSARTSGLGQKDINEIIRRSVGGDDALSEFFTKFSKSGKSEFTTEDIEKSGIKKDLIEFLDRITSLGLGEEGRKKLFRGAIDEETFRFLDKQKGDDRVVGMIDQVLNNVEGGLELQKEQDRFNRNQNALNSLISNNQIEQNESLKELRNRNLELEALIEKIKQNKDAVNENVFVDVNEG